MHLLKAKDIIVGLENKGVIEKWENILETI